MPTVQDLVDALAADEEKFKRFKAAADDFLQKGGYPSPTGVVRVLTALSWPELKAMAARRKEMDEAQVDPQFRLQMV